MRGFLSHNNKNRTNVKVDYLDIKIESEDMKPSNFAKLLKDTEITNEDDEAFLQTIPSFMMLNNLKKANFKTQMASFREMKKYYTKIVGEEKYQKQTKPFRYVNKGIFRKQANCYAFFKNRIALRA